MSEITAKWEALGGKQGFLGDALQDEAACPDGVGRYRQFQHGHIYWHPETGAHEVHGAIRDKYGALGWEKSSLGYPDSDEEPVLGGKGRVSSFQRGIIVWDQERNTCEVVENQGEYAKHYSEEGFWDTVYKFAIKAGQQVIEKALMLYFALADPDTPAWARGIIISALGYFIFPLDVVPDVVPVVGYSDDLLVLAAALAVVAFHIKPEHRDKAAQKLKEWF
ncbi:MAG: DUF1232 domain-containing protein [Planctomycetes bacterium]|nr:DUF1232 domain-containing protein [Planctomycetota bacterium]